MFRKFGLGLALASALVAANVNALGMGEIRVKSALNEPLHAEIALFQIQNLSPLQIKSRMADLNDFALSGLATQQALSNVRFQVRVRPNGTGRIILTSKLPVTEPFMNFLVEVNWPNGRLIREYTLLLDPPSYQSSLNGRAFNATENTVKPATKPVKTKPASTKKTPAKAKSALSGVVVGKGQYYITEKDTLWDIAIANRPSKRVTPQQMMVLIQQKNPQAFPNANINVMKAKQVIDLPTQAEIDALSVKDAQDEVVRQTQLWKSGKLPKVVEIAEKAESTTAAAKTAKPATEKDKEKAKTVEKADSTQEKKASMEKPANEQMTAGEATEKGMLNVISPEEEAKRREMQAKAEAMALAASKDSEKIAQLLQDNAELDVKLALSQESMDKLERDNTELNKKLETIVKQLEDINRLISLKDEQLAVLQDELSDAQQDQQKKEEKESAKSWLDKLLENTFGLIAAGVGWLLAIVATVFLFLRRKKKEPIEEMFETETKSEPSISLPEEVMDEEELTPIEDETGEDEPDDASTDMDDLDLDLDLDMDMDLDESFDPQALDVTEEEADDTDLAAELEAQLSTPVESDDDDDLDLLDGIDSLEFDLGETDEEVVSEDLQTADESDEAAEERALAEFAAAMEEDGAATDDQLEEELEIETLDEDALPDVDDLEGELEIEMPDADISTVEEDELDIEEITESVTSLEELEGAEDGLEEDTDLAQDMLDNDLFDLPAEDGDILNEQVSDDPQDLVDQDLMDEVEEQPEESLDELSLDDAAIDEEEEEEQIPMDDALDDLLGGDDEDEGEVESGEDESAVSTQDAEPALEEELDELLSSTDDDIALDTSAPELDADNEENIDLLSGEDGVRMKLDLARAYVEMGDDQGAKDIIDEVMSAGDNEQKSEAQELLASLNAK